MDEHLSKPIDRDALRDALARHLPRRAAVPPPAPTSTDQLPATEGLDVDRARLDELAAIDASGELLRQMAQLMLEDGGRRVTALRAGDGDAGKHAHALRGAAGNLGITILTDACQAYEDGRGALTAIADAWDTVIPWLRRLAARSASA